ncbi:MAG: FAD-dependent oxidoreductase [Deltaproteobacteria bacterium]|nr:FAD-dependent oxidoreductase [Deltaproteobacteria bacterium]
MTELVDVAVIGAGPAGLAAAIKAKESGAENVTIIERAGAPGGLLDQCIHNGFGLFYFDEDLTGPEFAKRFIEKAMDLNVHLALETMVLNLTPDKQITACNRKGIVKLKAKAVVLAMGCRERSREALMIPGTRPAGVFTAGTAQRYVNVEGFLPGKDIVILGSGDVGMIMARRLRLEGADVKAVVEILPYAGGLIRNEVQCLVDFDIPLLLEHTVTEVHGKERVEAVAIAKVDEKREPISGTERVIPCDTLLISAGLIPENEISMEAGVTLNPVTGGPFVDEKRETNVPGIFAAGNVSHVHDLVDNVAWEGEIAGAHAGAYATGKITPEGRKVEMAAGENIRYVVPNTISTGDAVDLYMRVNEPNEKVSIRVGDVVEKKVRVVKPSEMVKVELSPEDLSKIGGCGDDRLTVHCESRRKKRERPYKTT